MINQIEFLAKYGRQKEYESDNFKKTGLAWEDLVLIAEDFEKNKPRFERSISKYVKEIQGFDKVHSIRHRIKDTEHLIEKIIRKIDKKGKRIDIGNYLVEITDLMGIRILHTSRDDSQILYNQICDKYKDCFSEDVKIKIREGDDENRYSQMVNNGAKVDKEKRYRSIHYIIKTKAKARLEIQTRTIFEEGWSELDHDALYKGQQESKTVELASSILSRLVGTCDDMAEIMVKPMSDKVEQQPLKKIKGRDLLLEFIRNY